MMRRMLKSPKAVACCLVVAGLLVISILSGLWEIYPYQPERAMIEGFGSGVLILTLLFIALAFILDMIQVWRSDPTIYEIRIAK